MSVLDKLRGAVGKLGEAVVERQQAAGRQALVQAFADPDRDKRRAVAEGLKGRLAHLESRLSPERWASVMRALDGAVERGDADELLPELEAADAELQPLRPADPA